ncbi:glycosyltransferase family 2 protein [Parapedobacter deserti]|uniref:Glycosyltransferase family 2 protein n=1 Tax=Parapedobacter deserti TaxID=1912957 RepID=A0ABV7JQW8_9SPHI
MIDVQVSIIIVNYNTTALTLQCIKSIRKMVLGIRYEIIVVDNHSSEGAVALLASRKDITFIRNGENLGFGRGNNKGAECAKGKYFFFVNSDTYFVNDAATILHTFMEEKGNERVGCCGGMLLTSDGKKQASYGNFPSVFGVLSEIGLYRLYRKRFTDRLSIAVKDGAVHVKEVDYITGADFFVRSAVFRQVGGFDPDFFLYFEETELAWRIRHAGFMSMWVPAARIVHLEGGSTTDTSGKWPLQKIRFFTQSRYLYFRKTTGRWALLAVKMLLSFQALMRWIYRRERYYFDVFRIIVTS